MFIDENDINFVNIDDTCFDIEFKTNKDKQSLLETIAEKINSGNYEFEISSIADEGYLRIAINLFKK